MGRKKETASSAATPVAGNVDESQKLPQVDSTPVVVDHPNNQNFDSLAETHASGYEGFDPNVHAMGPDGKPRIKADGSFAKKRGRKAGGSLPTPDESSLDQPGAGPVVNKAVAETAAGTTCNLIFNGSVMLLGEDWIPSKDEATGMKMAFTDYYMARGIPNIPPEIGLIGAILAYAMPRPQTQALLAKAKSMFKKEPQKLGEDNPQ